MIPGNRLRDNEFMRPQNDTPETGMAEGKGLNPYFEGRFDGESDELRALRLTLVRERDEARALNAQWAEKAAAWFASPEAAQRLQGYRDLAQQVAAAQNERDEARAEIEQHVAKAVARETERCAKVCDDIRAHRPTTGAGGLIAEECAAAIRARGTT
jgi:hypothetical protein